MPTGTPRSRTRTDRISSAFFNWADKCLPRARSLPDAGDSNLRHRTVLGNLEPGRLHLVEMLEHPRIHMRCHDPPGAQISQPGFENLPGQVAGHAARIAIALDDEEVSAV